MGQLNQKNSLIVELLLFGPAALAKRGQITMNSSSFQQTASSGNTTGYVSPVFALKYIIKHCPITQFEISIFNSDGTRRTDTEETPAVQPQQPGRKQKTQVKGPKSEAARIQDLLDQRKPPTEKLPSLCAQYDDELQNILNEVSV